MIYPTNSLQSRMSFNLLKILTEDLPHFRVKMLECCWLTLSINNLNSTLKISNGSADVYQQWQAGLKANRQRLQGIALQDVTLALPVQLI